MVLKNITIYQGYNYVEEQIDGFMKVNFIKFVSVLQGWAGRISDAAQCISDIVNSIEVTATTQTFTVPLPIMHESGIEKKTEPSPPSSMEWVVVDDSKNRKTILKDLGVAIEPTMLDFCKSNLLDVNTSAIRTISVTNLTNTQISVVFSYKQNEDCHEVTFEPNNCLPILKHYF